MSRTIKDLAREALSVQDACNLSGVVHGFSRAITELHAILEREPDFSTEKLNQHPICVLWADKIANLTETQALLGTRVMQAYDRVRQLANAAVHDTEAAAKAAALASLAATEPFCACGRRIGECDGSRKGCKI